MSTTLDNTISSQIESSKRTVQALQEEFTSKGAQASEEADQASMIALMVLKAVAKIKVPKDGKDATVDYKALQEFISTAVKELPKVLDGTDGEAGYTPIKDFDYFDGENGKDGKDGKDAPLAKDGYTPVKGKDYGDGKDGHTPIKGVDYFDGKDGIDGKDGVDGITPTKAVDGVDGKDGKDGKTPKKGVDYFDGRSGYTPVKGVDYVDGIDGKCGKDGKSVKGKEGTRGKKGLDGKKGSTGVGIRTISSDNNELTIRLTDSSTTVIKLPTSTTSVAPNSIPVPPESFQRALRVPYDNKKSKVDASNVQEALDIALAATGGSSFSAGTSAAFMQQFNLVNDTHSSEFVYNASKQLISTLVVDDSNTVLYMIDFTYVTGVLVEKLITSMTDNDSVEFVFEYTDGLLTRKVLTYNA